MFLRTLNNIQSLDLSNGINKLTIKKEEA